MNEISGTYRDGHIELDSAVNWPEGLAVVVHPQTPSDEPEGTILPSVELADGTTLPWSDTPEFRAALLAQMDRCEPVELTPEEEAEWLAARQRIKEYTIAAMRREMGLEP